MWWCTSIRPGTTRLAPGVVCPSNPLEGRIALAPATASAFRNALRDAPESSGATFVSPKSLEFSGLLQKRFGMAAPLFQCLCWICGARYHRRGIPVSPRNANLHRQHSICLIASAALEFTDLIFDFRLHARSPVAQ